MRMSTKYTSCKDNTIQAYLVHRTRDSPGGLCLAFGDMACLAVGDCNVELRDEIVELDDSEFSFSAPPAPPQE
jgi:hypothetical protein